MLPALLPAVLLLGGCATTGALPAPRYPAADVAATIETRPVGTPNADAADDPAIWRNPTDPAKSLILGTDKKAGLYVYGLDGAVHDFIAAGALNNVDLRTVRRADGSNLILAAASDRTDKANPRVALFALDGLRAKLTALGSEPFLPASRAPAEAYGFCMGSALAPDELARVYVVLKSGEVAESRLVEKAGRIVPEYLRSVKVATQSEGCVIDDTTHTLYLAEEDVGIWQVDLSANTLAPTAFARVGPADGLVADVEGLAIVHEGAQTWLLASSQGDNAYAVFDAKTGHLAGRFRVNGGPIDGTSDTDGIEAMTGDFGPGFPGGVFVAQDGDNAPDAQNFKLVPWRSITTALKLD
ncbi:phytase [Novosphingobium sp. 9]|uniref:phytase n=1 Tax=Novosphingobium sp. 9 TaxID=2025349 RepID=UPI0021B5B780|nr:phytase [Novosphingobium sp. 9]